MLNIAKLIKMKKKSIKRIVVTFSILCVLAVFSVFYSCQKEDEAQKENVNQIELPYSKTITLTDEHGNSISFDLFSDDQILLNSYSERNYSFKGLTYEDILRQNEIDANDNSEGGDEEEYYNENETPITIAQKNTIVKLKPEFVGYSLEEKWIAPDEIADRGFDWHNETASTYDYAKVKNKRCCWAIYATWQYGNAPQGNVWTNIVVGHKIKGGKTSDYYGKADSEYIRLRIRYRKESHRQIYYTNNP